MKIDSPRRSFIKALSWRTLSIIITFSVALLVTGNAQYALSISLIDMLMKISVYYFHERYWTYVKWGRLKKKRLKKKNQKMKSRIHRGFDDQTPPSRNE